MTDACLEDKAEIGRSAAASISTAAILGHPLRSLSAASRVKAGASVRCDMQTLGRVGFSRAKAR